MELSEIRQLEDYKLLTPKQQGWLECYLLTDDAEGCTRSHYDAKEGLSLQNLTKKLISNSRIIKLVNQFNNVSEIDEALSIAWDIARDTNEKKNVRLGALETIARIKGWMAKGSKSHKSDEDEMFNLDDLDS